MFYRMSLRSCLAYRNLKFPLFQKVPICINIVYIRQRTSSPYCIMPPENEAQYKSKDAIGLAIESTLVMGAAGLTISAIQNTLTKQNISGWGVLTRTGGIIAIFGVLFRTSLPFPWH